MQTGWAARLPEDSVDLWAFVLALETKERTALLAHCTGLTVNAADPSNRPDGVDTPADCLSAALALDMRVYWTPTAQNYFGRVPKALILAAVREGVSGNAANHIASSKKSDMARAAERLLAATSWLPEVLRTPQPEGADRSEPAAEDETAE